MIPSPAVLRTLAFCAAATAGVLACSAPAQAETRQCFPARMLSSWNDAGDGMVYLRVGIRDFYELKLAGSCTDLPFAETIGLETRGGSSFICSGLDVNIIVPSGVTHTIAQRCMGASLRKLSAEEAKAIPSKHRP